MGPKKLSRVKWIVAAWALGMAMWMGLVSPPAGAEELPVETHCVIWLDETGATSLGCDHTRPGGLQSTQRSAIGGQSTFASNVLGIHFTGQNFTGSSITITGSGCTGLVWKPSGSWNNNIESSYHYCGGSATRFYDASSCSGSSKSIFAAASSLTWMNNRTSCVRYG